MISRFDEMSIFGVPIIQRKFAITLAGLGVTYSDNLDVLVRQMNYLRNLPVSNCSRRLRIFVKAKVIPAIISKSMVMLSGNESVMHEIDSKIVQVIKQALDLSSHVTASTIRLIFNVPKTEYIVLNFLVNGMIRAQSEEILEAY